MWAHATRGHAAVGVWDAWRASRSAQPELLVVEQSLCCLGHLGPDGSIEPYLRVGPRADLDWPDVVDDAVDELIEHVISRGGQVVIVADGALDRFGGAVLVPAATSRKPVRRPPAQDQEAGVADLTGKTEAGRWL